jgi:hypothetical protein
MDEPALDEVEGPPPIGLPSRELAIMLAEALRDMRDRDEEMDDETVLVLIAAAIEANNRQIYQDLVGLGVIAAEPGAGGDADAASGDASPAGGGAGYAEALALVGSLPTSSPNHERFFARLLDYDQDMYVTPDDRPYSYDDVSMLLISFLMKDPTGEQQTVNTDWHIADGMFVADWIEERGTDGTHTRTMYILRVGEDAYLCREGRFAPDS